jgi:hypothetical protein
MLALLDFKTSLKKEDEWSNQDQMRFKLRTILCITFIYRQVGGFQPFTSTLGVQIFNHYITIYLQLKKLT